MSYNILIVIPARGGSKGIPRKNVRSLNGKPLIYYSITTALGSIHKPDVVVSSEDDEILTIAKKLGVLTFRRPENLADDQTTLDPVIYNAYQNIQERTNKKYDLIITVQSTSPLLKTKSLDKAITKMKENPEIDTIISVRDDTHLTWRKENGQYFPNYTERLNRQYLTPTYRESGGFLITRPRIITRDNRIGEKVDLYELTGEEGCDIDTYEDWNLCEFYLKRKKIVFVVTGYQEVGLGHVYRCLGLANEILNHDIRFLVDEKSELALRKISESNYPVSIQTSDNILEDIHALQPDVIVNDILDTDLAYIRSLKESGYKVANFEDLGEGCTMADLVINAMYPEQKQLLPNHYFGHHYVCLKSEFYLSSPKQIKEKVQKVLLTFGGVDPNNYTHLVLKAIYNYCRKKGIVIEVIAGMGYQNFDSLEEFTDIAIHKNVSNMSEHMVEADLVFTSAGRTIFELTSLGVPTIVLAQNEREMTHFFADQENGIINLGLGYNVDPAFILSTFDDLVESSSKRRHMNRVMLEQDVRGGKKRVIKLLNDLITND